MTEACAAGTFAVYPIETIDLGIALLTGVPAAEIHAKVAARLHAFAESRKDHRSNAKEV